jgi:squalene cyclase
VQIRDHGGITYSASWCKFWLCTLGCYDWDGLNPFPPELWILPYSSWTGVGWLHPGRFWVPMRNVYLPLSYLYGRKATGPSCELVLALRCDLDWITPA